MISMWIANGAYPFWRGPNGYAEGMDYAMFASAAKAMRAGLNPYNPVMLHAIEMHMLHPLGLAIEPLRMARVASPPLFFWLLEPLSRLPFQPVAVGWIVLMYVIALSGFVAVLRSLDWRGPLPILAFAASPILVFAAYPGNVDGLVCGALGWSFSQSRSRPIVAGAVAAFACIKPQVGLPLALLIVLYHAKAPKKSISAFIATLACVGVVTVVTTGITSIEQWLAGIQSFQQHITVVPDLTSSAGLYAYILEPGLRNIISNCATLLVMIAIALAWILLPRIRPLPAATVAPLWFAVMFMTPFAHYHDFVVLAIPFAVLWKSADRALRIALLPIWFIACAGGSFLFHSGGVLVASVMLCACCLAIIVCCTLPPRVASYLPASSAS